MVIQYFFYSLIHPTSPEFAYFWLCGGILPRENEHTLNILLITEGAKCILPQENKAHTYRSWPKGKGHSPETSRQYACIAEDNAAN